MGDGGVSDASPLLLQWTSSHVTEHRCTPAFLNKLMATALPLLQVKFASQRIMCPVTLPSSARRTTVRALSSSGCRCGRRSSTLHCIREGCVVCMRSSSRNRTDFCFFQVLAGHAEGFGIASIFCGGSEFEAAAGAEARGSCSGTHR